MFIKVTEDYPAKTTFEKKILGKYFKQNPPCHKVKVLLAWRRKIDHAYISKFRNLKAVIRYGVGFDNVDLKVLKKRKIMLFNNPIYGVDEVSDTLLAMALNFCRRIGNYDQLTKKILNKKKKKNKIGRMKEVNYKEFLSKYLKKIKKKFPLIVMEKLYEPIFDLDILSSKGKIINAVFRKRIIPKDPNSGHKIIYNKQILISAMKISKLLNLNYINDCDFMIDRNKNFKLLEINPRPSGSLAVPHIAGFPMLDNLLDFCLGGKNFTKPSFFKKNVTISKKRINNYIF